MRIKKGTVNWGYHRNSTLLLADMMRFPPLGKNKTIFTYGKDAEFDIPKSKRWYVVNLTRQPSGEYKAFVNYYEVVK